MAIDAIVVNMDSVWTNTGRAAQSAATGELSAALKRFLQCMRDDGYPMLLMSELTAEILNDAISETLGENGIEYFSSILSSSARGSRYAVALHTLATPAHRVVAVEPDEVGLEEARTSGVVQCMPLSDALRSGSAIRPPQFHGR
ncbi:hypothetical protein FVF58_48920 [Paraburkholderia panacisoli]|uniref:Uncharacterized protein n=1 Tax=Paraburkholderia panacisoli TaxID=2603818 RepID=A0A5B0G2P0_9BURK|nr:hypothetical protein [Paraburkholderia panacisoli]KAA0997512.1 hypothetical protein FVF58_48920 [Paraburkholderia panacisoli]